MGGTKEGVTNVLRFGKKHLHHPSPPAVLGSVTIRSHPARIQHPDTVFSKRQRCNHGNMGPNRSVGGIPTFIFVDRKKNCFFHAFSRIRMYIVYIYIYKLYTRYMLYYWPHCFTKTTFLVSPQLTTICPDPFFKFHSKTLSWLGRLEYTSSCTFPLDPLTPLNHLHTSADRLDWKYWDVHGT